MIAAVKDIAGIGIYSPAEAALYARVRRETMQRWVFGNSRGEPVIHHQPSSENVTFLDLVQTLAIRAIRQQHNVPLQKIRQAIDFAEEHFHLSFPLARQHAIYLMKNHEVVIRPIPDEDNLVQASGAARGNFIMQQIAEPFLDDLSFDSTGLANRFDLFKWEEFTATMDPAVQFGQPHLPELGYTTLALYEAFQSEGSAEAAAEMYEVPVDAVRFACRLYVDYLAQQAV